MSTLHHSLLTFLPSIECSSLHPSSFLPPSSTSWGSGCCAFHPLTPPCCCRLADLQGPPPGCRPSGCNMLIPGFNDATHRAVVWICDQLPAEVQRQQLMQAPGTCLAAGWPPPSARWAGLPPPARGSWSPGAHGPPAGPGSYRGYAAAAGAAEPVAIQPRAAAAAQGRGPQLAPPPLLSWRHHPCPAPTSSRRALGLSRRALVPA
jgi:hypothetical protein